MTSASAELLFAPLTGTRLLNCVAEQGTAAHSYPTSDALLKGAETTRNVADAIHFLCTIHGRYPGVLGHAAINTEDTAARDWLASAAEEFSNERAFLARLTVEVGPIPSTPGAASAEAALLSQRHALDMIAQSERNGCAVGAAMALVLDWANMRRIMNVAGNRLGIEPPRYSLTDADAICSLADRLGQAPFVERAIMFGAQQIMYQHHGLWDLLEARQMARDGR